jgi:hypothetical protein
VPNANKETGFQTIQTAPADLVQLASSSVGSFSAGSKEGEQVAAVWGTVWGKHPKSSLSD